MSTIIIPLLSHAQSIRRHQVSAYINLGNAYTHDFEKEFDDFCQLDPEDRELDEYCGFQIKNIGYGLSYSYNVNEKLKLGVCGGISFSDDIELSSYKKALLNHDWENQYNIESKLWYVMPTAEYVWLNKRFVRMYFSASLGIAHINHEKTLEKTLYSEVDKEIIEKFPEYWWYGERTVESTSSEGYSTSATKFAYQVVPLGIEVGSKRCCFFQEWGYGYKGVFMAGVRFSF